ncbi:MAG TPA: 16S rRNA (uracil(1498)-N(3))-methyltransferase [Pseudorhodoplanes sp.]|nr:16S rRNA (uracil(1498)-N(3))-methyltransferase [Pseudorhodoplanes sp.]
MARYDFKSPRLFLEAPLAVGQAVPLAREQINYLGNVLRLKDGDVVLVFNGRDGEWRAFLQRGGKKAAALVPESQVRVQDSSPDLYYLFSPLKHARLDYMVQKAVELGVSRLQPVMMQHTQTVRVNLDRMRANAIEAAEQCGVLTIPGIAEVSNLERALQALESSRVLVFCDEDAALTDPIEALKLVVPKAPLAVLVGPEGGFAEHERAMVLRRANVVRLALGPRILRADTAAVAALTLVQAALGDWKG